MPKQNRQQPASATVEPWDLEAVHREFPTRSEEQLTPAIEKCKTEMPDAKDRRKLAECVSRKIR